MAKRPDICVADSGENENNDLRNNRNILVAMIARPPSSDTRRTHTPKVQEFRALGNQLFADRIEALLGVLQQVNALEVILGL